MGDTQILPHKFATKYESVIVSGEVEEVFGGNKQVALEGLIHKCSADFINEGLKYIERLKGKARVFKINMESVTGKARKQ